jgi:cell division protein FtsB
MSLLRRGPFRGRSAATVVFAFFVTVGLVLVFTGTLTRSTDIEAEAEVARAEKAELQARVVAGRAEVSFLETDAFVEQMARSIGYGEPGERPFALETGAPSPAPITPLGSEVSDAPALAPFDAWVELLFGA